MKDFFKKIFRGTADEIDNYQFKNVEDIILKCTVLSSCRRHLDAIRLYEKFENEIRESDYEINSLTTILKICQENFDTPGMIHYAKRLRLIAPDHPWIKELKKYHSI
jgi:hypothetical protein